MNGLRRVELTMVKIKTADISGMGGSYELCCQVMLSIGREWIKDKPLNIWEGTGATVARSQKTGEVIEFYGIMQTSKQIKKLEKIWSREVEDYTGAMHQAVLSNLNFIHRTGYENWLDTIRKKEPERIYEIDPDDAKRKLKEHIAWSKAHPQEAARRAFEEGKRAAREV